MATTAATLCGLTFIVFVCRCSGYYAGRGSLLPLDAMAAGNVPPQGDPYGLQAYQHMQPRGGVGAMGGYMTGREQQIQQRQFEQQQLQHHQLQQQQQQQQLEQHQQLRVQQQQHQQLEQNQQLQLQQQQHQQQQLQQQQQEQQQHQQLQQQQLEQQQLQQLQQHQQLQQQQQQQQQPQQHPMFGRRPQFLGRRMFVNPGLMGLRNRNMFFRQPMINRGLIRGAGIRPPPFVYRGLMGPQQPQYIYRRLPTQPIIPIVKQPMITKPKPVIQKPIGISKKKVQGVKTGKGKSGGHTKLLPGDYSIMIGGGIGGTPRLLVKDGADTTIEGLAGKILIESGNQISFESNSIF